MALRKVAVMGHPVLRKVALPVPEKEITRPAIKELIHDMAETMAEYDGRGLAAPQIHESLQVVVMIWDFDKNEEPYLRCLINPVVKPLTQEEAGFWEGCLSVPGMRGHVSRPNRISVECFDQDGQKEKFEADGFAATVIQHECDHLIGKLYIDRMKDLSKLAFNQEFQKYLATGKDEDEE